MKRRIYLASSWRNPEQPEAVRILREAGHEVYDFRNPPEGTGFAWEEVQEERETGAWMRWTHEQYMAALRHPRAEAGYAADMNGMLWADTGVLLLPCGRSAHLEAGWFAGWMACLRAVRMALPIKGIADVVNARIRARELIIVHPSGQEPELMAKMADAILPSVASVVEYLDAD